MDYLTSASIDDSLELSFKELFFLESLIKLTKESCLEMEMRANYYNLQQREQYKLSEERNHYINLLTIAQEKVSNLKNLSQRIEERLEHYSNTPTIAAER